MPAAKDYFTGDEEQVAKSLAKAKKAGKCLVAFGMGKEGSLLAVDYRGQQKLDKFLKQIRGSEFSSKYVVGNATVSGTQISIEAEEMKGSIKSVDVKDYLRQIGAPITKAEIVEPKGNDKGGKKK